MNQPFQSRMVAVVRAIAATAPELLLEDICAKLKRMPVKCTSADVLRQLPVITNAVLVSLLADLAELVKGQMTWAELGWSLETAAALHRLESQEQTVDLVWSGPPSRVLGVRRIDQVLYDLINGAKRSVTLITFAAAKIQRLNQTLVAAAARGVKIQLILEFEAASKGQLTSSAIKAFAEELGKIAKVYYWPLDKREVNQAGLPGKLHAKCAVVDNAILISSANLTDDALNRNMEVGSLIRGGPIPKLMLEHLRSLVRAGVLKRL